MWANERHTLAHYFQSRTSEVYGVDIHPAAKLGKGIMIDHGTGVVIGETSVVEDNVSIFQGVTLGGTGKETGDRHPKVREGVCLVLLQLFLVMLRSEEMLKLQLEVWF